MKLDKRDPHIIYSYLISFVLESEERKKIKRIGHGYLKICGVFPLILKEVSKIYIYIKSARPLKRKRI